MSFTRRTAVAAALAFAAASAFAQPALELKIMAPAGAGGGWDSTSRSLQQVLNAIKVKGPEREKVGSVVKPIWLFTMQWIVPPMR